MRCHDPDPQASCEPRVLLVFGQRDCTARAAARVEGPHSKLTQDIYPLAPFKTG